MPRAMHRRSRRTLALECALVILLHAGLWLALTGSPMREAATESGAKKTILVLIPEAVKPSPPPIVNKPATTVKIITPNKPAAVRETRAITAAPVAPAAPDAPPHAITEAPMLDLEALKKQALADDKKRIKFGVTGLPEQVPRDGRMERKLGQDIANAARKDCKSAYGGAGLLAVIPLAIDLFRESGCKW